VRMKSFFAGSVQVAIEQARKELGPDAMLVTSRTAGIEARHLGEYEVVFATELPQAVAAGPTSAGQHTRESQARISTGELGSMLSELRELRRQFQSWRQAGLRSAGQPHWITGDPQFEEAYGDLIQAEVDRELAEQLLAGVQNRLCCDATLPHETAGPLMRVEVRRKEAALRPGAVRAVLAEEIRACVQVDSSLGVECEGPRMVALVGPPGAGKTATIAKLVVRYGLSARKPSALISLDTLRVAASEQLRCYASLLGIAFQVVENNRALAQAIEEHRGKDLILIDTPGFTPSDLEGGCEAADFLARRGDIQKHLTLPASIRFADLARISSAFDIFRPSRLIFTRTDETATFGPLLCEAAGGGRPLSFLGTGQRVPEDLEPASQEGLLKRLLPTSEPALSALSAA
jgi:flagellar biosynthesis protein FlhF